MRGLNTARGFVWQLLGIAALAICAVGALGQPTSNVPLARVRDVLDLPRSALTNHPPVHVQAVVTYVDKSYQMVFIQDASAGIFLFQYSPHLDLAPGDWLDVQGVAAPGLFSPIIGPARIASLGKTNLPTPREVSMASIVSGALVGERVDVRAMVQRVEKRDDHLILSLAAGENRCSASVREFKGYQQLNLVDARVRLRGVSAASFNKQNQATSFQVIVDSLSDVEVFGRPEVDAFGAPVCPLAELWRYAGRRFGEHRVHMRGVVTLHWPNRVTAIQDATGGVTIENGAAGDFAPGDEVDVAGFMVSSGNAARLRNAEVRKLGVAAEPPAVPSTLADAATNNNRLVRIMARVIDWQPQAGGEVIGVLEASDQIFTAVLPSAKTVRMAQAFPPGCYISTAGVLKLMAVEGSATPAVALWLRNPSDILLLRHAPASPWRWVIISGFVAGALGPMAAAWIIGAGIRHRRALAQGSRREREAQERFEETERQLRRSHRERDLIGQDLHDNIIQSIYSVGLGIDEARRLADKSPERVADRLNVAVQSLNSIIRDVRAFIAGLEPKGLEGHELKTALKSVLLTSGEDQQSRFSIEIDPTAARDLTSMQATEIFNIAKEAMSNSMRHAHARRTTVSLIPQGRGVRLEVADDGAGFDPEGVSAASMGLRNIKNRARDIGAQIEIISVPGQGTKIVVDIPLPAHDNH